MKLLSKLKTNLDRNKLLFLTILLLIGIITGTILFVTLNNNDYLLVKEELNNYFTNLKNINLNKYIVGSLISNMSLIVIIWLLGISVIGIPVVLFIYFFKSFEIGFTISSFIAVYNLKGIILALLFVIFQLIFFIGLIIVTIYSINLSSNIVSTILKKKVFDFKIILNRYLKVLVIATILTLIYALLDNYLLPIIFKLVI